MAKRQRPLVAAGRARPDEGVHLRRIREEEAAVAAVEAGRAALIAESRGALGIEGHEGLAAPDLWTTLARPGIGKTTLVALTAFVAADQILGVALAALGPEVRATLGLSQAAYGTIVAQRANAAVIVAMQFAFQIRRRAVRRALVLYAGFAVGAGAVMAAYSTSFWPLFLAVAVSSPSAGAIWAAHRPLIMDRHPPSIRVRAMSLHQGGAVLGAAGGPFIVWFLMSVWGFSWRGVLAVVGLAAVGVTLLGSALCDAIPGDVDTGLARSVVRSRLKAPPGDDQRSPSELRFTETLRRLWAIPTVKRLLAAWAVLGVVITPLTAYMSYLLQDRFHMTVNGRAGSIAAAWALALPALIWFAPRGERLYRAEPARLVRASAGVLVALAVMMLAGAASPVAALTVLAFGATLACSAVLVPALSVMTLSVVTPESRGAAGALVALFLLTVGGEGGAIVLGGLSRRFGPGSAIALLAIPALAAAGLLARSAPAVEGDIDQLLGGLVEEEEVSALARGGSRLPMLACRHVDFSYGQLQVLFDVDFTVDDGEIVALLGTNGAGKSTLLRVVCGLGVPSRGTVRFQGTDITHVDTERRVALGISQVPGGRAVFGPLTVVENLRVLGYMHGRDRRAVERGIDASFAAFPALADRRNQLAATLSGGEQQMLGLATAIIVRPRLLLIDELSLGLAPKIVGELLNMVRQINAAGTAIVLVEQSVNVALSVVQHAYFMEKGQVRFDGEAAELLDRPDLLRSVFLEGASKGLSREDIPVLR